jgi:hypothetical protein
VIDGHAAVEGKVQVIARSTLKVGMPQVEFIPASLISVNG